MSWLEITFLSSRLAPETFGWFDRSSELRVPLANIQRCPKREAKVAAAPLAFFQRTHKEARNPPIKYTNSLLRETKLSLTKQSQRKSDRVVLDQFACACADTSFCYHAQKYPSRTILPPAPYNVYSIFAYNPKDLFLFQLNGLYQKPNRSQINLFWGHMPINFDLSM